MKVKVLLMGCLLAGPVFAEAVLTPAQVQAAYRSSEAQLLDRSGAPLQSLRVDMKVRRLPWVPLADISPAVQQAVLLAEDQRFMRHGGVDVSALATAAWDNLFSKKPRGASTITMQLAGQLDANCRRPRADAACARNGTRCAPPRRSKTAGARRRFSKRI